MKQIAKDNIQNIDKIVAQNVKKFRVKLSVTQRELAHILGVSVQQIQKYESGINRLSSGKLYKISKFLKIGINNFFASEAN